MKYSYRADFAFEGQVGDDSGTIMSLFYDNGATGGHTFATGDTNGDGVVDDTDATVMSLFYLTGTGGDHGPQL